MKSIIFCLTLLPWFSFAGTIDTQIADKIEVGQKYSGTFVNRVGANICKGEVDIWFYRTDKGNIAYYSINKNVEGLLPICQKMATRSNTGTKNCMPNGFDHSQFDANPNHNMMKQRSLRLVDLKKEKLFIPVCSDEPTVYKEKPLFKASVDAEGTVTLGIRMVGFDSSIYTLRPAGESIDGGSTDDASSTAD